MIKIKLVDGKGRIWVHRPDDPRSHKGYRLEHIVVAETAIKKSLPAIHPVHHVDEDPGNNVNKNLVICQNQAYHLLLHQRRDALLTCGNPNWRKCTYCKKYDDPKNMVSNGKNSRRHKRCLVEYQASHETPFRRKRIDKRSLACVS